jgi:hypothetical protein
MAAELTDGQVGDLLSSLLGINPAVNKQQKTLDSIDKSLKELLGSTRNMSMSNARSSGSDASSFFRSGRDYKASSGKIAKDILDGVSIDRIIKEVVRDSKSKITTQVDSTIQGFLDGLEDGLLEGFGKSDFQNQIKGIMDDLAKAMGVSVKDIRSTLGREFSKRILDMPDVKVVADFGKKAISDKLGSLRSSLVRGITSPIAAPSSGRNEQRTPTESSLSTGNTSPLRRITARTADGRSSVVRTVDEYNQLVREGNQSAIFDNIKNLAGSLSGKIKNVPVLGTLSDKAGSLTSKLAKTMGSAYGDGKEDFLRALTESAQVPGLNRGINKGITSLLGSLGGKDVATGALTGEAAKVGSILAGSVKSLAAASAQMLLFTVAVKGITSYIKNSLKPAIEGTKALIEGGKSAANRYYDERKKFLDTEQKRLEADVRTMISTPFEILNKAAEQWYNAWDNNLRKISGTQGYTKADLQDLMSAYAERLRSENLTSVVSAADLTNNLSKVLDAGLSGKVAEEFAYLATKLNAAVPTQDFFSYAADYASIAANAIKNGYGTEEAIAYANQQLTQFASNVLYASREIAGGFTTGLKDAQSLFKQSVQIAQASKSNNATEISGVLTSVSAIVGAVAPDLAESLVNIVYKAAVGGNSSDIVALRSLAGINASNTEFLKALTTNPKQIFVDLFTELAKRQAMSEDAYMEVAEGLSSVFGVSMDAFARVDFRYLADAIQSMSTTNAAIEENIRLLQSGETTTTAEQLKIQQINKMILDEGLSYVLDNEAARAIQQHMWDEQLARQITESEYAVNLQGSALKFLEGISNAVNNIFGILNPFNWISKIVDLIVTAEESSGLRNDIANVLQAGKVGKGNQIAYNNLITRGKELNLVDPLVNLLGGKSSYFEGSDRQLRRFIDSAAHPFSSSYSTAPKYDSLGIIDSVLGLVSSPSQTKAPTSLYRFDTVGKSISRYLGSTYAGSDMTATYSGADESPIQTASTAKLQSVLNGMSAYLADNKASTYEEWAAMAAKQLSVKEFASALDNTGLTEETIKGHFQALQTQLASKEKAERERKEESFWSTTESSVSDMNSSVNKIHEQNTSMMNSANESISYVSQIPNIAGKVDDLITKSGSMIETATSVKTSASAIKTTVDAIKTQNSTLATSMTNSVSSNKNSMSTLASKADLIVNRIDAFKSQFSNFFSRWEKFYIQHTVYPELYSKETNDSIKRLGNKDVDAHDAIYMLVDALTQNKNNMQDPAVQTNVLLAELLKVALALLNKSDSNPGSASLPSSYSAMAIGREVRFT